jgi:hypothetical protein
MSVGGCAIESIPFTVDDIVHLRVNLHPVAADVTLTGRVVRHDGDGTVAFTGIEFMDAKHSESVILNYLLWASRVMLAASLGR